MTRAAQRIAASLRRADHQVDRARQPVPVGELGVEAAAARFGQRVELHLAAVVRLAPLGLDPALLLEPVERRVQRALLHLQLFLRDLLDALADGPAMFWLERHHLEDQQVERALHEIVWFPHWFVRRWS